MIVDVTSKASDPSVGHMLHCHLSLTLFDHLSAQTWVSIQNPYVTGILMEYGSRGEITLTSSGVPHLCLGSVSVF